MAALAEIETAARLAAEKVLRPMRVIEVRVEEDIGSEGNPILRIVVVVPDKQFDVIGEDDLLDGFLRIGESLRQAGDDREVVVTYGTPSDLEDHGAPEV